MIFKRSDKQKNYFLPEGNQSANKLFIFTEKDVPEFSLEKALEGFYTENYLIIFYKNVIDYSATANSELRTKALESTRIYWLDDFSREVIGAASYMYLNNKNIVRGFSNFGLGIQDPNIQITNRGAVQSVISLSADIKHLIIKPTAGSFLRFDTNAQRGAISELRIFIGNPGVSKSKKKQADMRVGSVNFQVFPAGVSELPQPVSPFLVNKTNNPENERAIPVHYFDKSEFTANADLLVSLQPYKSHQNSEDEYSSFLSTEFKKPTYTNFSDQNGNKLFVRSGKIMSRAVSIEYRPDEPDTRRFYFIPQQNEIILMFSEDTTTSHFLSGFSGTEAFKIKKPADGTKLIFREVEEVSINKTKGLLEKNGNSRTSIIEIKPTEYFLDSEGAPLFKNNQVQSNYHLISKGQIETPVGIPLIPTFSFGDNKDLVELEEVFKKVRLKNIGTKILKKRFTQTADWHVTPQGFLNRGGNYELIKKETGYQFSIDDQSGELDLSLRKDEVFFVLTPGLCKEYASAKLKGKFSINKSKNIDELFELDLSYIFEKAIAGDHDNTVVIFKFHKKAMSDLLKDTRLWSNNGSLLGNEISLNSIVRQISEKRLLDIRDTYFTESVLKDPNWNGIAILNIPIGSSDNLPTLFSGLSNSQRLNKKDVDQKLPLNTELNFKYAAFPVNKTAIEGSGVSISSTSFYGLIDYDPFEDNDDYRKIADYFDNTDWKFVLSKLKVQFTNSKISFFEAFSFAQVPNLFEDKVTFDPFILSHGSDGRTDMKPNLIRLKGSYQKNSDDTGEFLFNAELAGKVNFGENAILKTIDIGRVGFSYDSASELYRFDLDATALLNEWSIPEFISINKISFSNIGLGFKKLKEGFPKLKFDLSKLFVLPEIDFDGNGFLSSFPIKFSRFSVFKMTRLDNVNIDIKYDFLTLPGFKVPAKGDSNEVSLFSLIFDFDLGTLGDLAALKALKGQLLMGWSVRGGFVLGLRLNGPSTNGLHIDLFGALKLDIEKVEICKLENQFLLRLIDARLKILGVDMPPKNDQVSALIFAKKGNKIAWLISYITGGDSDVTKNKLTLGIGQRVGIPDIEGIREVQLAIDAAKRVFDPALDACTSKKFPEKIYKPDNNWLVASENIIPEAWKDVVDLKFVFNDPVLYGVFLRIVGLFDVDILYKKVSDNLGVWSIELALDPSLRNIEMGAASVTLPNIGIDLYTNGDWRGDIGYPRSSTDWSRSCLVQLRPFVGWGGFYVSGLKTASLSLFAQYEDELPAGCNILQAGFAFRIGIGAYIDKGIFYVGASISVYGILEGAFAFNRGQGGLKTFFPDHFALRGRVGALAELVGYVDFKIIKASVHIILRVEFGFLLVVINGKLKPVPVYLEGEVSVRVSVTICCFRVFGKRICIVLHFSFRITVRFPYTIGGDSNTLQKLNAKTVKTLLRGPIKIQFGEIPILYIPSLSKSKEGGNQLVHQFAINFFGCRFEGDAIKFSKNNILKDNIIRPIFTATIAAGRKTYQQLRAAFLKDSDGQAIEFDMSSYIPSILAGCPDLPNEKFLKDYFGFEAPEAESFLALLKDGTCDSTGQKCPYRIIPVPISSKIKVVSEKETLSSDANGFAISIEGLFKDSDGASQSVSKDIRRDDIYQEADIKKIEEHFDSYRTQFTHRKKSKIKAGAALKDLREDLILQEYFKLIGLLTLETYFNFLFAKTEEKDLDNFNPEVILAELFSETGEWKFNDHLEEIMAQLNYFYNNGLRLPVRGQKPYTKGYYELLNQSNGVHSLDTSATMESVTVDVILNRKKKISLKEDIFQGAGVSEFRNIGNKIFQVDFDKVAAEFRKPKAQEPFALMKVLLPLSNSNVNTPQGKERFFEIPRRLAKNLDSEKVQLVLRSTSNSNAKISEEISFVPCINVSVKAKPHIINGATKVLEITNVYISDLMLMHKLKESNEKFAGINVYIKETSDNGVQMISVVKPGQEGKTTIFRSNLSPRTHPPVIIDETLRKRKVVDERYSANLTEQEEFIRILWTSLTTNNGGFYLLESVDSDLFNRISIGQEPGRIKEVTLTFSFYKHVGQPFSAIHNWAKVSNANDLFDKLDKSTHSLHVEVFRVDEKESKRSGNAVNTQIQEYHASLPAHCFSFLIERDQPDSVRGHDLFLPVEFGIEGSAEINPDKVLPLMPTSKEKEADGILYSHVSPLQKVTSVENTDRYINVGKSFNLNFGVRDSYGFRAFALGDILKYRHIYFDKLVPLASWPFIEFGYWFKHFKNGELAFDIQIKAFAGIAKVTDEERGTIPQLLHTILAQLSDKKVEVKVNYATKKDVQNALLQAVTHVIKNLDKPGKPPLYNDFITFTIQGATEFKTLLQPVVSIARPDDQTLYPQIDVKVWDSTQIKAVDSVISLQNPEELIVSDSTGKKVKKFDIYKAFNNVLAAAKLCPYTVGIGSDSDGEKAVYLLRKDYLEAVKPKQSSPLPRKQYFAIKPYSNSLWSGNYKPSTAGSARHNFTNIDLDKGLKIILAKVDELLSADNLLGLINSGVDGNLYAERLVWCKRQLVDTELKDKTDNIDEKVSDEDQEVLRQEFRDLLLHRLTSFYDYDGVIQLNTNIPNPILSHLGESRLSISFEKVPKYRVESSKLDLRNGQADWIVLFDQIEDAPDIELELTPQITHVEFDIADLGSGIERSNWIQLVEPVIIQGTISTKHQEEGKKWPFIRRIFPPKPLIVNHSAEQIYKAGDLAWKQDNDLGKWQYVIKLDDQYESNDQLDITVSVKSDSQKKVIAGERNFKGFIAYWSTLIAAGPLKSKDFIDDLTSQMNATVIKRRARNVSLYSFSIRKIRGVWQKLNVNVPFSLSISSDLSIIMDGKGFDIFKKSDRIKAILPHIKALRNRRAVNDDFVYITDTVTPSTWAVPHIRYDNPIQIADGLNLDSVFSKIAEAGLPYKSTAKFLLNTTDLTSHKTNNVPAIPVLQMELNANTKPAKSPIDNLFDGIYKNGFPAVSLTVYNDDVEDNNLPIFTASTIFKKEAIKPKRNKEKRKQEKTKNIKK